MSEQTTGTDQETGAPPPDPNTPAQSSEVPAQQQEGQDAGQAMPKSPDEDPGDEAREGGTETHPRRERSSEGDES